MDLGRMHSMMKLLLLCLVLHETYGYWTIEVDLMSPPLHETDSNFIGFNIDTASLDDPFPPAHLGSVKARTLLKGLSPSVLRVGGSGADYLFFNKSRKALNAAGIKPLPHIMSTMDWDFLVNLTTSVDLRLLFCFNLQLRYGLQWNPGQAIDLFEYSKTKGYGANLDWELGNEPAAFFQPGLEKIPGPQVGEDFLSFYHVIRSFDNLASSRLVGPDVVGISNTDGISIMKGVANTAGSKMDGFTFHQYYFRGDVAKWQEYINPSHFKVLASDINQVKSVLKNTTNPNMKLWIGETSDAWHTGTQNVSDRYISGFLWMEKLGLSAKMGISVILRQTFNGGNYSLVDDNMDPNPDYWLTYIYKQLVGPKVLSASILNYTQIPPTLRMYAQCTRKSVMYPQGSVTVFGLSVNQNATETLVFTGPLANQVVYLYLLTGDGPQYLLSKYVALNGKRLELVDDYTLPQLKPVVRQKASDGVVLPPCTFAFMVFPDANSTSCK